MSAETGLRETQRRRTRRALLDAALSELAERSLGSLGLREVTRAAGVAPTAFYRHFRGMDELGTALVEEALASLHGTVREILTSTGDADRRGDAAVRLIGELVRDRPGHVRFLVRERHGGVRAVREAIAAQLDVFADEIGVALGADRLSAGWEADDVTMLSRLLVDHMFMTASAFLTASLRGDDCSAATGTALAQLRLIHLGRVHWADDRAR
ncbi:TetR family transcriptional regulator [Streptomyces erythrochromogenes]|uniref:TetR family transcriptional regulator n=1 Tax=Streptomyces erythrochromogenes TaxID=285574 RepID=A0ABZ1QLI2_9ACTN|nr:TetR family transcriptional regulator [Streptomyces erythrochromogenes]MCX5588344.1 TetR family transcriptional regulator [Streptomyces erythrochromogenes]